jgi:hypothetical protein
VQAAPGSAARNGLTTRRMHANTYDLTAAGVIVLDVSARAD